MSIRKRNCNCFVTFIIRYYNFQQCFLYIITMLNFKFNYYSDIHLTIRRLFTKLLTNID